MDTYFTSNWNDGRVIDALVNACALGLYSNWNKRDLRNALENTKEAIDLADRYLGIPQLILPHEMIHPKVDEQSMMTYLSQYPNKKLNSAEAQCYDKGFIDKKSYIVQPCLIQDLQPSTATGSTDQQNVVLLLMT